MIRSSYSNNRLDIANFGGQASFVAVKATMPDGTVKNFTGRLKDGLSILSFEMPRPQDIQIGTVTIKAKKTLYVHRPLINAEDFISWAKSSGFQKTLEPDDLHCTIAFSRTPVEWNEVGKAVGTIKVSGGPRSIMPLGDKGAVVLRFDHSSLQERWKDIMSKGASWDWDGYRPHVTITYNGDGIDLSKMRPYRGDLVFGPEKINEVIEDWEKTITEKAKTAKTKDEEFVDEATSPGNNSTAEREKERRKKKKGFYAEKPMYGM